MCRATLSLSTAHGVATSVLLLLSSLCGAVAEVSSSLEGGFSRDCCRVPCAGCRAPTHTHFSISLSMWNQSVGGVTTGHVAWEENKKYVARTHAPIAQLRVPTLEFLYRMSRAAGETSIRTWWVIGPRAGRCATGGRAAGRTADGSARLHGFIACPLVRDKGAGDECHHTKWHIGATRVYACMRVCVCVAQCDGGA